MLNKAEIDLEIDGIEDNVDVPAAARTRFRQRERKTPNKNSTVKIPSGYLN
jgi:hypothetical protein